MNWKSHLILGAILTGLIIYLTRIFQIFKIQHIFMYILLFIIFTLIPDIDIEKSFITKTFLTIGLLLILIYQLNMLFLYIGAGLLLIVFIATKFTKHRAQFHHPLILFLYFIPMYFLGLFQIDYLFLATISFLSHLILDIF